MPFEDNDTQEPEFLKRSERRSAKEVFGKDFSEYQDTRRIDEKLNDFFKGIPKYVKVMAFLGVFVLISWMQFNAIGRGLYRSTFPDEAYDELADVFETMEETLVHLAAHLRANPGFQDVEHLWIAFIDSDGLVCDEENIVWVIGHEILLRPDLEMMPCGVSLEISQQIGHDVYLAEQLGSISQGGLIRAIHFEQSNNGSALTFHLQSSIVSTTRNSIDDRIRVIVIEAEGRYNVGGMRPVREGWYIGIERVQN